MRIQEAMEVHDTLNPKIFDSDNHLNDEVREALNNIINQFTEELKENEIPIRPLDAFIVGSNASFNYTENSDLDVHIIANFDEASCDTKTLNILYNFFKSYFNDKYDISIHDIPVELYIEDQDSGAVSNGIYSLNDNDWVKFPEKIEIPEIDYSDDYTYYEKKFDQCMAEENSEMAANLIDELYLLRKKSIAGEGEYGKGNLVFKDFRNEGKLDQLKALANDGVSKELSLENLREMLMESKEDEQKLIDFAGEELAQKFFKLKPRMESPQNDLYFWIKKGDPDYLRTWLLALESTPSKSQLEREAKQGAKLLYNKDGWKIYRIDTYKAATYYGKNTKWCISGNYPGSEGEGRTYFDKYLDEGVYNYYFIISPDNHKWCYLETEDGFEESVLWNEVDDGFTDIRDDEIPNFPKDAIDVLPGFRDRFLDTGLENRLRSEVIRTHVLHYTTETRKVVRSFGQRKPQWLEEEVDKLIIHNDIKGLDFGELSYLEYLKEIYFEEGCEYIGTNAFTGNYQLVKVHLPDSLKYMYSYAFKDCTALERIYLPDGIRFIGEGAFLGCSEDLIIYCGFTEEYADNKFNYRWLDRTKKDARGHAKDHDVLYNVKRSDLLDESLELTEDIEGMKKYYIKIPEDKFQSLVELDPTYKPGSNNAGTYGKWILNLANKNNGDIPNIGHVTDVLKRFDTNKKQLKNKDIMSFKSIDEIDKYLNDENNYNELSARQRLRQTQKSVSKTNVNKDAEKVFEDDRWEVWVPHTYEASCKLGRGTQWCTATTETRDYFDGYTRDGKLYININKATGEKYQFHFESESFMDADDEEINLEEFFMENMDLAKFYKDKSKQAKSAYILVNKRNSIKDGVLVYTQEDYESGIQFKSLSLDITKVIVKANKVAEEAFYFCQNIVEVILEEGVNELEPESFSYCNYISFFRIPSTLETIRERAFVATTIGNTYVPSLDVWNRIDFRGNSAIPSGGYGGSKLFVNDKELTKVIVTKDMNTDFRFEGVDSIKEVIVEEGVTTLGRSAFFECKNLESVQLPDTLVTINNFAFSKCDNLTNIDIPNSVVFDIDDSGIFYNSGIERLNIPGSVKYIPHRFAYGCNSLKTVNIGDGVEIIGNMAFSYCGKLESVYIPKSVVRITPDAFKLISRDCVIYCEVELDDAPIHGYASILQRYYDNNYKVIFGAKRPQTESLVEEVKSRDWIKKQFSETFLKVMHNLPSAKEMLKMKLDNIEEYEWEQIEEFVNSLNFPLVIYRGLKIDSLDKLKVNKLGINWTIDDELFFAKNSAFKGINYVLEAEVDEDQINWPETIHNYVYYSLRPQYGMYPESEITLKPNYKLRSLSILKKEDEMLIPIQED